LIGQTLRHFKITAKLGEGGMGEVYRAEDSQLGRQVAIKVLPEAFTEDAERLARFEREARVLASLNHPNIAGIHQIEEADGLRLLVMELVEGEDLADRLARGPVSIEDATRVALQVAEALESAHEQGVVHRDLKPANIKITPGGQAKVLDFGLAKALEAPAGSTSTPSLSMSPTLTAGMTGAGVLLGTAAYMAPEQAKGLEPDRRADVWAFGVVVWEMLTGKRLFAGDSVSDTLAAVLRDEIDGGDLPSGTPESLRALLGRCLDRDPKSRLRDIGEARVALAALASGGDTATLVGSIVAAPAPGRVETGGSKLPWLVAAVMTVIAVLLGLLALRPGEEPRPVVYSQLVPPEGADFDVGNGLALSPDGTQVVFAALDEQGRRALWVRSLEDGESRQVNGSDGASYPFWSPDSRHVGFMSQGDLKRVPAAGGPAQTLAAVYEGRGASWGPDGTIVYAPDYRGGLWRIPAGGGEPVEITQVDAERGEQAHRFPLFLPGGKQMLLLVQTAEGGSQTDDSGIEILDLETGERTQVVRANSSMAYAPSGHLLYWRDGSLLVVGFDPETATIRDDPVVIAQGIGYTGNEFATFAVSNTGLLAYQSGTHFQAFTRLFVRSVSGEVISDPSTPDYHQDLRVSHDGRRAAYRGSDNKTIWLYDIERQTKTRFTFEDGDHFNAVWSPGDEWIAYVTDRSGKYQIFRKPSTGLGEEELLFETDLLVDMFDWSPDGRFLSLGILDPTGDTDRDVALLDIETGELEIVVQSPLFDSVGRFSPDGRWLAYQSADSGQFEIFVVPLFGRGGRFQVSTVGGAHPDWHPDGNRLYYVNPLVELMAVDLNLEGGVQIGVPQKVFDIQHQYSNDPPFQVMPDGQSFLVSNLDRQIRGGHLTLIQNWPEGLPQQ
jgi:Tol biopolymer transport system component